MHNMIPKRAPDLTAPVSNELLGSSQRLTLYLDAAPDTRSLERFSSDLLRFPMFSGFWTSCLVSAGGSMQCSGFL